MRLTVQASSLFIFTLKQYLFSFLVFANTYKTFISAYKTKKGNVVTMHLKQAHCNKVPVNVLPSYFYYVSLIIMNAIIKSFVITRTNIIFFLF